MKINNDVTTTNLEKCITSSTEWEILPSEFAQRPPVDVMIFPNKTEFLLAKRQLASEGKDIRGVYPIKRVGSSIAYSRFDGQWLYEDDHMHLVSYYETRAAIAIDVSTDWYLLPGNVVAGDGGRWIMIGEKWACYSGNYIYISKEVWEEFRYEEF